MIAYGQRLTLRNGDVVAVDGCMSRQDAVWKVVDLAGEPPPRWWEFGRKWPADCVAEYYRQKALK